MRLHLINLRANLVSSNLRLSTSLSLASNQLPRMSILYHAKSSNTPIITTSTMVLQVKQTVLPNSHQSAIILQIQQVNDSHLYQM